MEAKKGENWILISKKTKFARGARFLSFFAVVLHNYNAVLLDKNFKLPSYTLLYLLIELFHIGMPVVRTDGRAGGRSVYGHVITQFSPIGSLPHFFTHGAPLLKSDRINGFFL